MERKIKDIFVALGELFLVFTVLFLIAGLIVALIHLTWTILTVYHEYWFIPFIPLYAVARRKQGNQPIKSHPQLKQRRKSQIIVHENQFEENSSISLSGSSWSSTVEVQYRATKNSFTSTTVYYDKMK